MLTNLTDAELGKLNKAFYNAIGVDPEATLSALQAILGQPKVAEIEIKFTGNPCRLYTDEKIIVPACEAEEAMPTDKELFPGYLSSEFANWEDDSDLATPETEAVVSEMQEDMKFKPMFNRLNTDLDQLCWSKNQIKKFVIRNRDKLHPNGWATFFLCKINGNYRVAGVDWDSPEALEVFVHSFERDNPWHAGSRRRVVVPVTAVSQTLKF